LTALLLYPLPRSKGSVALTAFADEPVACVKHAWGFPVRAHSGQIRSGIRFRPARVGGRGDHVEYVSFQPTAHPLSAEHPFRADSADTYDVPPQTAGPGFANSARPRAVEQTESFSAPPRAAAARGPLVGVSFPRQRPRFLATPPGDTEEGQGQR
jgi:hypothetical protein